MPGSPERVLVTRPEPGATESARRLEELGFIPVKLPLQEVRALPVGADAAPEEAAAVAITSANAIRHAPHQLLARLAALPCFAVGESTAAIARAGFATVVEGRGDAGALAETVIAECPAGTVVYLCGRVRRPLFEQRLTDAGVTVVPIETYDAIVIVRTIEETSRGIGAAPVDHALLYSVNAAEALLEMLVLPELKDRFKNTRFACISGRVADVLADRTSGKILVAEEPTETALLTLLKETTDGVS
jgi:uroporphyrinogen-III synthase